MDKKKQRKIEFRLFIYFCLMLSSILGLMQLYEFLGDEFGRFANGCYFISLIVFTILFLLTLRKYLRMKKVRKPFELMKKLFSFIRILFFKVMDKLGIQYTRKVLYGSDRVEYVYPGMRKSKNEEKIKKYKLPKWSALTSNRERIRYIYTVFLLRKHREGYKINPTSTPAEICGEVSEHSAQNDIFDLYNTARYSDDFVIEKDKVKNLLETYKIKK